MPVVISPSSELGKELRKWEQHHTRFAMTEDGDSQPGNPYRFRMYPLMLYKAQKRNGQIRCLEGIPSPYLYPTPDAYDRACMEVEAFNKSCQLIVRDEDEAKEARAQGWRESVKEAEAYLEGLEQDMANAAAEANFRAARMSEPAQREWNQAQDATSEHVVDVRPARRGRPKAITGTGPVEE